MTCIVTNSYCLNVYYLKVILLLIIEKLSINIVISVYYIIYYDWYKIVSILKE